MIGDQRDAEAKPQRGDQQHLVALEFGDVIEQPRHADEPDHQHHGEKDGELEHFDPDLSGMERARPRKTRKQRQENDGEDVLDDEDAEDDLGEGLPRFAQFRQRLDDDGGRGNREHRAEENAVHRVPAEGAAHLVAEPDHQQ